MCFSNQFKSFFSQVNIFIHYSDATITLTPHTKLTREAEKERLLPWLAPAKMNSLTSECSVLLDWICLPACLCQSLTETEREIEWERNMEEETWKAELCQMLTCHWGETKGRARGFRAARSFLLPLHLIFPHYRAHLHGTYIIRTFKAGGEQTCGWSFHFVIKRWLPHGQVFNKTGFHLFS